MNETSKPAPPAAPAAHDRSVLDWARDAGAGDVLAGGLQRYLQRRRRRRLALGSAACVLLLLAGAVSSQWRETDPTAPAAGTLASATVLKPEQRTLPDGTRVDLNAGAEIEVQFADAIRRVVLRQGEAHFQVAKDPQHPFVVSAGTIEVRAVGTAFVVEVGTSAVDVLVTEGRVAVNPAESSVAGASAGTPPPSAVPELAALGPGARVVIEQGALAAAGAVPRVTELSVAAVEARLAWRVPRLKFAGTPLTRVVAMFNEHAVPGRDPRLVLAPGVPATLRLSGTLRADDVDSLLRLLAGEFGISAETRAGETVLRKR